MNSILCFFNFSVFLCSLRLIPSDCALVKVYNEPNYKGKSLEWTMDYGNIQCMNLPSQWSNQVSSINTDNHCVQLFSQLDCNGKKISIYQGTAHYDLALWRFDKKTESVKLCDEHIDHTQDNVNTIVFNEHDPHTYYLNVDFCENIPSEYDTSRIRTINPLKACFQLFPTLHCQGQKLIFRKNSDGTIPRQNGFQAIVSVGLCNKYTAGKHESVFKTSTANPSSLSEYTNDTLEELNGNQNETNQTGEKNENVVGNIREDESGISITTIIALSAVAVGLVNTVSTMVGFYNYYKRANAIFRQVKPIDIDI